jgi:hypothetical protein
MQTHADRKDAEPTVLTQGLYLYCIADGGQKANLGKIGIDENEVYIIPYKDIGAVVHTCLPEPYKSENTAMVTEWVLAHQKVVETAWKKFGTVLPLGFDTIVKGGESVNAEQNLMKWLKENYEDLKAKTERVRGRVEVGIQIFWNPTVIAQDLTETNQEIRKLKEEMEEKPPGMAYFYKQKMEQALRKALDEKADVFFKDFYGRIRRYADDLRVEKTKKVDKNRQMLMNLSVLIHKDKIRSLGEELAKIEELRGFDLRFTGPWPPYSFVAPR